ncbi:MAG: hypothetical protein LBF61_01055 [Azoarcus sp.]|nr:hypothetical protein [Azoarcus sp.]
MRAKRGNPKAACHIPTLHASHWRLSSVSLAAPAGSRPIPLYRNDNARARRAAPRRAALR